MKAVLNNVQPATRSQGFRVFVLSLVVGSLAVVLNGCDAPWRDASESTSDDPNPTRAANASLPPGVNASAGDPRVLEVVGRLGFNVTNCPAFLSNRASTKSALAATLAEAAGLPSSVVTIKTLVCHNMSGAGLSQRRLRATSTTSDVLDSTYALYPSSDDGSAVAASLNDRPLNALSTIAGKHFKDAGLPAASLRSKTASSERTLPLSEEVVGEYCYVSGAGSYIDMSSCTGSFVSAQDAKTDCSTKGAPRCAGIMLIAALGKVRYATCSKIAPGPAENAWQAYLLLQPKDECAPKAKYVLTGFGKSCVDMGLPNIESASECFNEARPAVGIATPEWHLARSVNNNLPGCYTQVVTYGNGRQAPAMLFNPNKNGHGTWNNRRFLCKGA